MICIPAGAACVAESVKHFSVPEYLTAFANSAQEISCFAFIKQDRQCIKVTLWGFHVTLAAVEQK